ncbi:hypothetical protein [Vibrio anguillarum]|uniref:hypothetical protein n=1 Tax=Vibrio anguillarum TaxID=55601 RepID=UPI001C9D3D19|nr:hypothetical protein [Vibrio anguillarum]MBY7668849.1 hypothetical protein [Vibrio anguillarum]
MIELTGGQALLIVELGEYAEILHWGQKVSDDLNGYRMGSASPALIKSLVRASSIIGNVVITNA